MIILTLKERIKEIKVLIPAIFIALKATETPFIAKVFAGLTIMYALSPIDLIPDFIPFFGYLDDLLIIPILIKLTLYFIPSDAFEIHKEKARNLWEEGYPKKWYYAAPIVLIWILALYFIYRIYLLAV